MDEPESQALICSVLLDISGNGGVMVRVLICISMVSQFGLGF